MFDVGFFELTLIAVIALIVVGPERLPKLARTAGMWLGRGRRMISSVKADIDREIRADELRRTLEEQKKNNPLHTIIEETKQDFEKVKSDAEAVIGKNAGDEARDSKHER